MLLRTVDLGMINGEAKGKKSEKAKKKRLVLSNLKGVSRQPVVRWLSVGY